MHIVLSGYYGFDNIGDEAILFSIIQALRKLQDNVEITVLSNNPEHTRETYHVNAVNRWRFQEVREVMKRSDGLISGGGSLLQDQTGMKSIPYYTGIMHIARWYKKPVFIYAQGMGPINKQISKCIAKNALNRVDKITVRDLLSKELLENIGVKKPITIVPDPVLGLDGSLYKSNWTKEQPFKESYISVSVRDWPTEKPYKKRIAACLDQLIQDGQEIVFIPMHGEHDEKASKEVAALMKGKSYIAPAFASIEEKIAIIGESKLLIGMRLHSLIFSAVNYTPFVAISYDPKIDAFASMCEQPIAGHVAYDDWDQDTLLEKVSVTLNHLVNQELDLKHKVQQYQRDALNTPKLAIDTFNKR